MVDYYAEGQMVDNAALQVMEELANDLLQVIQHSDGAEIHKDEWPVAIHLADKGLISLGSPRGPDRAFRRAELVTVDLCDLPSIPPNLPIP